MFKLLTVTLLQLPLLLAAETTYSTLNYSSEGSTFLTGIRGVTEDTVYMTGVYTPPDASDTDGILYLGTLAGDGDWYELNFPSAVGATVTSTALYGPNTMPEGIVRIAGSYKTEETGEYDLGLYYEGTVEGVGTWITLAPPVEEGETLLDTIAHSNHGNLLVGNFDTDLATGRAFIYDIANETYTELTHVAALSITAYGVWHNGGESYTIAGGIALIGNEGLSQGYIVDYNAATHIASNWTYYTYGESYYDYVNGDRDLEIITHFDGITGNPDGGYNLTGDWIGVGEENGLGFFATVLPNEDSGYGPAAWTSISYPSSTGVTVEATSGNSVYEWTTIGIYTATELSGTQGYVATIARPYLVEGAFPLGNDWYASWMGVIYVSSWPWVFQSEVGWFFGGNEGNSNTGSWFYFNHPVLSCWLWSSEENDGWFYGQPAGQDAPGWWYYDTDSSSSEYFYFFSEDGQTVITGESATTESE